MAMENPEPNTSRKRSFPEMSETAVEGEEEHESSSLSTDSNKGEGEGGESEQENADDVLVEPGSLAQLFSEEPHEPEPELQRNQKGNAEADAAEHITREAHTARQALSDLRHFPWPDGPSEYPDLFGWPERYAKTILDHPDEGSGSLERFLKLTEYELVHHEGFAGSGGAGIALHMAWNALRQEAKLRQDSDSQSQCPIQITVYSRMKDLIL